MKNTFKLVLLASLVVFAAACGKKNESGGSSSSNLLSNNVQYSQASVDAVRNFNEWYKSRTEGTIPTVDGYPYAVGTFQLRRINSVVASSGEGCDVRDIEVFGVKIGEWYDCSNFDSGTSSDPTTDCRVIVTSSTNTLKPNNATLKKIYEGKLGTLVNATKMGTVYHFQFQDTSTGSVKTYVINTQYHSALQPVQVTDLQNSSVMELVQVKGFNVNTALSLCQ